MAKKAIKKKSKQVVRKMGQITLYGSEQDEKKLIKAMKNLSKHPKKKE